MWVPATTIFLWAAPVSPGATFVRNPNFGYWADPARIDDTAVAGVVRLEWTGPDSNRLYVERRNHGRSITG